MNEIGLSVKAPKKWMEGWNKLYVKAHEEINDEIKESELNYPVQQLLWFTKEESDNPKKKKKLLEFACGDGKVSCFMAKQGYHVKTFDALETSIKLTTERARKLNIPEELLQVELGNMDSYPLEKDEFDVIITLQCLQYLFDGAIEKIEQIKNAIKPKGFFIYSGNVLPHEDTGDIKIRFITQKELRNSFQDWIIHSIGRQEILLKQDPEMRRGYTWIVAQKK